MNKKSKIIFLNVFLTILFVVWPCLVKAERAMNMRGHATGVEREDFGRGVEHRHDEGSRDYFYHGQYYRYHHNGRYYNYFYRGRYYRDCRPIIVERLQRHPSEEMECH